MKLFEHKTIKQKDVTDKQYKKAVRSFKRWEFTNKTKVYDLRNKTKHSLLNNYSFISVAEDGKYVDFRLSTVAIERFFGIPYITHYNTRDISVLLGKYEALKVIERLDNVKNSNKQYDDLVIMELLLNYAWEYKMNEESSKKMWK